MIIQNINDLIRRYHRLGSGDVVNTRVVSKHLKQTLLIDLAARGIHCIPSALSQVLNGSKTAQGWVLKDWMLPATRVIQGRSDLMKAVREYPQQGMHKVVTKADKMHCGYGIRLWENIETLYSFMAFAENAYPFLLQPFVENITDVRVIVAGDYLEAYVRINPDNFRQNLSAGGTAVPYALSDEQTAMCRAVMERGKFPFAHIDLQVLADGSCYLSEIALNGGVQGAIIDRSELDQKKQAVMDAMIARTMGDCRDEWQE